MQDFFCPKCSSKTKPTGGSKSRTEAINYIYRICLDITCNSYIKNKILSDGSEQFMMFYMKRQEVQNDDIDAWNARMKLRCSYQTHDFYVFIDGNKRTHYSKKKFVDEVPAVFMGENNKDMPGDYWAEEIEEIKKSKHSEETKTHLIYINGNTRTVIRKCSQRSSG